MFKEINNAARALQNNWGRVSWDELLFLALLQSQGIILDCNVMFASRHDVHVVRGDVML